MRNFSVVTNGIEEESPNNDVKCIYKEVVVIGNGPSGITLSYLLNGYRPYYNKIPHPDPMLSARLIECTQKSLIHQDLSFLSQGIEGRSKNPISLLVDAMTHPGADMGLEWPSLLTWKKTGKCLDHIVLGKGHPGGTWPTVPDHVLTISPGRWMALPGLEFKEYQDKRAPASAVAQYYREYIKKQDLTPYMASHSTVTMIQPITSKLRKRARWKVWVEDASLGTVSYESRHLVLATGSSDKAGCLGAPGESLPHVTHNLKSFEEFLQRERSNGRTDSILPPAGRIGQSFPRGRLSHLPKAKSNGHLSEVGSFSVRENGGGAEVVDAGDAVESPAVEAAVWGGAEEVEGEEREIRHDLAHLASLEIESSDWADGNGNERVLIVGAGLSAADAIRAAWRKNFRVVHAFRRQITATELPAVVYPEYHELYSLMEGLASRRDYLPLAGYQVTEFFKDRSVRLADSSGNVKSFKVKSVAILIGSRPDLSFLPKTLKNLGIDPNEPVDCKSNPVQIDPFSYKCVRAPPGLYALGPLVGDNFVRFLQGGAVAITGHIFKDNNFHKGLK